MKFDIEITDPDQLAGITEARKRYVADNPDAPAGFGDRDYLQMVLARACESYANAYVRTPQTLEQAVQQVTTERSRRQKAEADLEAKRVAK